MSKVVPAGCWLLVVKVIVSTDYVIGRSSGCEYVRRCWSRKQLVVSMVIIVGLFSGCGSGHVHGRCH